MNNLIRYKLCAGLQVPAAAKLMYCYLTDISENHCSVEISVKKLSKSLGLSRSAVRHNLHRLKRFGMIGIVPRYTDDGGRLSNKYIFI